MTCAKVGDRIYYYKGMWASTVPATVLRVAANGRLYVETRYGQRANIGPDRLIAEAQVKPEYRHDAFDKYNTFVPA